MTTALPQLLTPERAAERLGIGLRTLRNLTDDGLIRYINVGAGRARERRRYREDDLAAFVAAREKQQCRSSSAPAPRHIPTISNIAVLDFQARRPAPASARRSPSKS